MSSSCAIGRSDAISETREDLVRGPAGNNLAPVLHCDLRERLFQVLAYGISESVGSAASTRTTDFSASELLLSGKVMSTRRADDAHFGFRGDVVRV